MLLIKQRKGTIFYWT